MAYESLLKSTASDTGIRANRTQRSHNNSTIGNAGFVETGSSFHFATAFDRLSLSGVFISLVTQSRCLSDQARVLCEI